MKDASTEADFGEFPIEKIPQAAQTAGEDGTGTPTHSNTARLEDFKSQERSIEKVAQFVGKSAQPLRPFVLAQPAIFGDRAGNGIV